MASQDGVSIEETGLHASASFLLGNSNQDTGTERDRGTMPFPTSELCEVRSSPSAGRGVFTRKCVSHGTVVLTTTNGGDGVGLGLQTQTNEHQASIGKELLSPTAYTIFRPYRREVCAECFAYDRGREWKVKLWCGQHSVTSSSTYGETSLIFCKEDCRDQWHARYGGLAVEAFVALEAAVRKGLRRKSSTGGMVLDRVLEPARSCTAVRASEAWTTAGAMGVRIVEARTTRLASKAAQKALRLASEPNSIDPDTAYYLLTGLLAARSQRSNNVSSNTQDQYAVDDRAVTLPSLMALDQDDEHCYCSPAPSIETYTTTYLLLLAILPLDLLRCLTPRLCHELCSRASHNAFSIRPSGKNDGEQSGEYMGWGVWPEASFFNHSCAANLAKERRGRCWYFTVDAAAIEDKSPGQTGGVAAGEELCITYLGGDERDLDVQSRRKRLNDSWGFWCRCRRCVVEEQECSRTA